MALTHSQVQYLKNKFDLKLVVEKKEEGRSRRQEESKKKKENFLLGSISLTCVKSRVFAASRKVKIVDLNYKRSSCGIKSLGEKIFCFYLVNLGSIFLDQGRSLEGSS